MTDDTYMFNLKCRRELHELPEKHTQLLHLIVYNILNNPNEEKFKRIKMRKIDDKIFSLLSYAGFTTQTYQFEPHAIFKGDFEKLKRLGELVEERLKEVENSKSVNLEAKQKIKAEKEYKKSLVDRLRDDFRERQADKELRDLRSGKIKFEPKDLELDEQKIE